MQGGQQAFDGEGEQKRGQPLIKQRSDGKPERSTAKKFKTSMQIHGGRPSIFLLDPDPSRSLQLHEYPHYNWWPSWHVWRKQQLSLEVASNAITHV